MMTDSTKLVLGSSLLAMGVAFYKDDKAAAFFAALAAFTTYYSTHEQQMKQLAGKAVGDVRTFSEAISAQLARIEGGLL